MQISSVRFTTPAHNAIEIITADGAVMTALWPCATWHAIAVKNWQDAGNTITAFPTATLEEQRADKLLRLADRRYRAEIGGCVVGGVPLKSDRESQALITGAALAATLDAEYEVRWKTPAGFVTLDAVQVLAMATGLRQHVQACFDREEALTTSITEASDQLMLDAIDIEAGWPGEE